MGDARESTELDLSGLAGADSYLPFHQASLGVAEERAIVKVLRSGWITRGDVTARFEQEFADRVGAVHAVGLNSCTAALHLALLAAGAGPGTDVITTPYTFAATANAIVHTGASPVFADIDPATLNIDPGQVSAKIGGRTIGLIPVHFGGAPCDMNALGEIAADRGLTVIEDAAHALGAASAGKKIGSISPFTAFSFYATKNITTGEGGMLTTGEAALADRVRRLSLHGMSADAWKRYSRDGHSYYEVVEPGFKYNMFDIQAAMGREQLKKDAAMLSRRGEIAAIYDRMLSDMPLIRTMAGNQSDIHAHHLYVVLLKIDELRVSRDQVAQAMEQLNIGVSVHFRSLHLHPYYRDSLGLAPQDFPNSLMASESALSLPIYPAMDDGDAITAASVLRTVLERFSK